MDRIRSLSVGSGPRSDLGASSLSGSETSILAQAMVRAKQFEEEEKQERMGKNCVPFKILGTDIEHHMNRLRWMHSIPLFFRVTFHICGRVLDFKWPTLRECNVSAEYAPRSAS